MRWWGAVYSGNMKQLYLLSENGMQQNNCEDNAGVTDR